MQAGTAEQVPIDWATLSGPPDGASPRSTLLSSRSAVLASLSRRQQPYLLSLGVLAPPPPSPAAGRAPAQGSLAAVQGSLAGAAGGAAAGPTSLSAEQWVVMVGGQHIRTQIPMDQVRSSCCLSAAACPLLPVCCFLSTAASPLPPARSAACSVLLGRDLCDSMPVLHWDPLLAACAQLVARDIMDSVLKRGRTQL